MKMKPKKGLMEKKIIVSTFILIIFLAMYATFVWSACSSAFDEPHELRKWLRTIVLNFLEDPASSPYTISEIKDLLDFYKQEKYNSLITSCEDGGTITKTPISSLLEKTITECNDGVDNDNDGLVDLNDVGCTGSSGNDETNCGDNVCEGPESSLSCNFDCGLEIVFMKAIGNAISFDDKGNVALKGTLSKNSNPQASSDDEFIVKDGAGNSVAIVNLATGNMAIKGSLFEKQAALTPSAPSSDFIVRDNNGNVVSYIDDLGNFYLKGVLIQNGNP